MTLLGFSPLPQPDNLFTMAEYRTLIEEYYRALEEDMQLDEPWKAGELSLEQVREKIASLNDLQERLRAEYEARLPVYLLARCPLCGGRVWEAVDTYSLNGLGWKSGPTGLGWYGVGNTYYQAECEHVEIVAYCVNLDGLVPDDVFVTISDIGPEKPYVMRATLDVDQTYVVVHALPIGRYDDPEPRPRYTLYFMTYFTGNKREFEQVIAAMDIHYGLLLYSGLDYELAEWVEAGKVLWLDPDDPELPLRSGPVAAFPYADVQGETYPFRRIEDGRVKGPPEPLLKSLGRLFGRSLKL